MQGALAAKDHQRHAPALVGGLRAFAAVFMADGRGEDFYHAGLTVDLEAAIASPELARYQRILILGYSLGGHVVLRYAANPNGSVADIAAVINA